MGLARRLLVLAGPVILTQLGTMGFGVVDILMLGRVGVVALDASALANLWLFGTVVFGIGVIFGLDPIVAQAEGRGEREFTGLALQRCLVLAAVVSVPLMATMGLAEEVLLAFGQDPELSALAEGYLMMQWWSLPGVLVFYALRQYLQAREIVAPALWVTLITNVLNIIGNQVLIFELDLGLDGAGLASGITRASLGLGLAAWIGLRKLHVGAWQPWSRASFDRDGLLEILRYGLPIGVHYTLEVWAFQCSTLLAGELGRAELAAHSIVLNVASVTFMVPLGLSQAASTIVGNQIGAGRRADAQRTAYLAIAIGAGFMLLCGVGLTLGRGWLAQLYTSEALVIAAAATIFPIAGAFQLADGIQVVGAGVLRGMGKPAIAAVLNAVAFYLLALPLAGYLVLVRGAGLEAIWWSLALGLAVVAGTLVLWIRLRGPDPTQGLRGGHS